MTAQFLDLWSDLSHTPLLWLTVTLVIYQAATWLYRRARAFPVLNPVLISIITVVALLLATGTPYEDYFDGARFIHFLLGPATVALAIPLHTYLRRVRELALPIAVALPIGALTAILSAVGLGRVLDLPTPVVLSLAPKSVTTPIAMGVAEQIDGVPSLTAVFVILTGILGGIMAPLLLDLLRVRDPSARGFAMGVTSHGIGTARALQMSEEAGAFSGLGMGLNGILTSFLVPLLMRLLGM
ncbi:MAG: LrgB family protein [Chloroflexi bacterium]|jgi:predicted murein hydrolase (TIGR00659 family)|nr:LrgB family protein [Chloroflexota bacterium]